MTRRREEAARNDDANMVMVGERNLGDHALKFEAESLLVQSKMLDWSRRGKYATESATVYICRGN